MDQNDHRNTIMQSVAAGILVTDVAGRVVSLNLAAEALTGWRSEEPIGLPWAQVLVFPEGLAALTGETERKTSAFGAMPQPLTIGGRLTRRDGKEFPVLVQRLPLDAPGGREGYVYTLQDMSSVQDQIRLREELLTNIAHEFRTPLASLVASIEMLDTEHHQMSEAEVDQLLGSLHRTIRRMESLVNNILDEASLRAGRLQLHLEPTDLLDIIEDAVLFVQPMLDQRQQRLEIHLPEALDAVRADEQRAAQVLINLLDNASKYSPYSQAISLSAQEEKDVVRIYVRDNGPGIAKDKQHALFERFSRLAGPDLDSISSTGLGLAIAKAIVERHGGEIGLDSDHGTGTSVWFTLLRA